MKRKIILFSIILGTLLIYLYFAFPISGFNKPTANVEPNNSANPKNAIVKEVKEPIPGSSGEETSIATENTPEVPVATPTPEVSEDVGVRNIVSNANLNALQTNPVPISIPVVKTQSAAATSDYVKKPSENSEINILPPRANEMVIYKPDPWQIDCYSLLADGNILITSFAKKDWWTWNIQGWYIANDNLVPSKDKYLLAGGGTDWEYVLRVAKTETSPFVLSGGNHGKECIRSIVLYNGDTGKVLDIAVGAWRRVKSLKIEEKTALTFDDARYDGYAEVTRTYNVTPADITLKSDFLFTQDVYMGTSYICMFPVQKKIGQNFWFKEKGHVFRTPSTGITYSIDGNDNYLGNEATKYVSIWGEEDDRYAFNVWIRDQGIIDDFQNTMKVFVWDMDKSSNKLYFSKYNNNYEKIVKGTVWHNMQGWSLGLIQ